MAPGPSAPSEPAAASLGSPYPSSSLQSNEARQQHPQSSSSSSSSGSTSSAPRPTSVGSTHVGDVADLKHCFHCGRLLETTRESSTARIAPSHQIVSIGSHAFVVSRDQADDARATTAVTADASEVDTVVSLFDQQGRAVCHSCHESDLENLDSSGRLPRSSAMSIDGEEAEQDTHMYRADANIGDTPSLDPASSSQHLPEISSTTPLAISIGDRLRAANAGPSSAPSPLTSRSERDGATPENMRRSSVTRSDINTELDARPPTVRLPSRTHNTARETDVPPPSVPGGSGVLDQVARRAETSKPALVAVDEQFFGPEAMTRPRLSQRPRTSHRSHSPSASRTLNNALKSPFRAASPSQHRDAAPSGTRGDEIRPPKWFDPLRPDPMADISRLRAPSRGRGCLTPGGLFRGTQKSGRLSYDVTVEILNVDLPNSHLDGYLNIRGLTEDWPEMTTFFTAEIIGQEHGFSTGKWGATDADDMKHWSRFAPFKGLHKELISKQHDTTASTARFNHMNKPFIFMRWKERFLVPDWRVRDIHGASFAGFYYVCAEFGDMAEWMNDGVTSSDQAAASSTTAQMQQQHPPPSTSRPRTATSHQRLGSNPPVQGNIGSPMPPTAAAAAAISTPPRTRTPVSERRLGIHQSPRTNSMPSFGAVSDFRDAQNFAATSSSSSSPSPAIAQSPARRVWGRSPSFADDPSFHEAGRGRWSRDEAAVRSPLGHSSEGARPSSASAARLGPDHFPPASTTSSPPSGNRQGASSSQRRHDAPTSVNTGNDAEVQSTSPFGKITAFYYHENSEPYQKLDLRHVPHRSSSSFEMR